MPDVEQLNRQKERILSTIRLRGPSLPVQIARALSVDPIFASAFLSELKAEDKVLVSNLKVGSSPLYYISGQEELLEKFIQHLNGREREAFSLLKQKSVLEDDAQTPVNRVALRAIKDFAIPLKVRVNGESKLFWKHFLVEDSEVGKILSDSLSDESSKDESREEVSERKNSEDSDKKENVRIKEEPVKTEEDSSEKTEKKVSGGELVKKEENSSKEKDSESSELPIKIKEETDKKSNDSKKDQNEFSEIVKNFLDSKNISLLESLAERKKDFEGKVRIDTMFGEQDYYLVAKNKKSTTDNDLVVAWQKAQGEKLPALVMCTGELNKKAKKHLEDWGNLVKWEKIDSQAS